MAAAVVRGCAAGAACAGGAEAVEEAKLRVCTGCRAARYCSATCQRADYQQHKGECRRVRATAARRAEFASVYASMSAQQRAEYVEFMRANGAELARLAATAVAGRDGSDPSAVDIRDIGAVLAGATETQVEAALEAAVRAPRRAEFVSAYASMSPQERGDFVTASCDAQVAAAIAAVPTRAAEPSLGMAGVLSALLKDGPEDNKELAELDVGVRRGYALMWRDQERLFREAIDPRTSMSDAIERCANLRANANTCMKTAPHRGSALLRLSGGRHNRQSFKYPVGSPPISADALLHWLTEAARAAGPLGSCCSCGRPMTAGCAALGAPLIIGTLVFASVICATRIECTEAADRFISDRFKSAQDPGHAAYAFAGAAAGQHGNQCDKH
jgi:hypothetical protein